MAVAFKGNTISIIILCVVTIVAFVFWGFDRIQTTEEAAGLTTASNVMINPSFRKKDYVGALSEAVRQIRADTNLIHQRFEMDYEPWQDFYMMIWNMPEHAWEIIRYKFAVKILKGFLDPQAPSFTMIFTGTSVTAGHESFYGRSYVGIIEERFKKTLAAAGIQLVVRNAAQPAFGCQVNNYCFPSLSINPGEEIDFFAWENTFNCGAENAPSLEYFSRVAAQHKAIAFYSASGGAPLNNCEASPDPVPYSSYEWTPEVAGITHSYSPSMAKVNEYKSRLVNRFRLGAAGDKLVRLSQRPYKGTAPHGMSMYSRTRQACNVTEVNNPKYIANKPPRRQLAAEETKDVAASSITMPLKPGKKAAAANNKDKANTAAATASTSASEKKQSTAKATPGVQKTKTSSSGAGRNQSAASINRSASCMTNDLWAKMCHDKGGPKLLTREFSYRGNAPGVLQGKSSYNPSAGSHLLRAELFLYNYYHILLDAIFNLQKDLSLISAKHTNDPDAMFRHQLEIYERKLSGLQRTVNAPLAEPKHCPTWECGNPIDNTQCFTDYSPNYAAAVPAKTKNVASDHSLSSLIVGNATKAGWQRLEKNVLSAKQFGNKDRQIYFYSQEFNARLPILLLLTRGKDQLARNSKEADLQNETEGIVKLYAGSDKALLENAEFYLETDVASSNVEVAALQKRYQDRLYAASSTKTPIKLVKDVHYVYMKGHVHFFGLPKGNHVLIVQTPSEQVCQSIAQRLNAGYLKQYQEQQEDADVSTKKPATTTVLLKKNNINVQKSKGNDEMRRALADEEEDAGSSPVKKMKALLKPKESSSAAASATSADKEEEKKAKSGPKVVDAAAIAKTSVGQLVIF